jgi:hypothetical protein
VATCPEAVEAGLVIGPFSINRKTKKTQRVGTESKVVATCPEAVAKIREPLLHINKIREYLQEAADFQ